MPDVGISIRMRGGRHKGLTSRRAQLYQLAPVGVFPIATLRVWRHVPPVRMRAALTAAGERRRQEPPGDLHRLIRVEIDVYTVAGRLAAQQTDVLAVGPVGGYLLFGDPKRLPPFAVWVLLAGGDWNHGRTAANKSNSGAAAFLCAHAVASSGVQSVRATSTAAAISASSARLSV